MIYGALPEDLGLVDLSPKEMMLWLYCPISTPGELEVLPPNLQQFGPILDVVYSYDPEVYDASYVYITAKTLWVSGDNANRPGWHTDGFGTDDINYVWYDRAPTEFMEDSFHLPDNCEDSMAIMTDRASRLPAITYPDKHLLRLTPFVVHRSPIGVSEGLRTFVKISISRNRYDLEGNSVNHGLKERWPLLPRGADRNHPISKPSSPPQP